MLADHNELGVGMKRSHRGRSWFALAMLSCVVSQRLHSQAELRITVEAGKQTFFEGEPVYLTVRLSNRGVDTAWVMPPDFGSTLELSAQTEDGSPTSGVSLWVDGVVDPRWRGDPLAPGESVFRMALAQDRVGDVRKESRKVYSAHLGVGRYRLIVRYDPRIPGATGAQPTVIQSEPVTVTVRPRDPSEDAIYREVVRVRELAWDKRTQGRYLSALVSLTTKLHETNRDNPFLAFLLIHGMITAQVLPTYDPNLAARLLPLRLSVAAAQRDLPAGAWAAMGVVSDQRGDDTAVSQLLGASMAGDVARDVGRAIRRARKVNDADY